MFLEIHPHSPQARLIEQVCQVLKNDGVILYPTDTTYSFGCGLHSKKAMKRIHGLKELNKNHPMTFICHDFQQFQEYTKGLSNRVFRQIKSHVPGPYTFVLEASKQIPKMMLSPRSTIGVRIPNAPIATALAQALGEPLLSTSVAAPEDGSNLHNPHDLHDLYGKLVDLVVGGGELFLTQSAIVDFSVEPPEIIRSGDQDLDWVL